MQVCLSGRCASASFCSEVLRAHCLLCEPSVYLIYIYIYFFFFCALVAIYRSGGSLDSCIGMCVAGIPRSVMGTDYLAVVDEKIL